MADIRELIILSPRILDPKPETPLTRRLSDLKMAVRRAVVRSARLPWMAKGYGLVYRAHLWITKQIGKRFEGTCVVYASSGLASGEMSVGVSDVDIAIYGDWPEEKQFLLMKIFGALMLLSPLFDKASLAQICRVDDLRALAGTDMLMALMYAKGARQWKVLYGRNVLGELPPIEPERFDGCIYMEVRRWWSVLAPITFGHAVTSRDGIFQNSICFKAVAEMLRAERMVHGGFDATSRRGLIEEEYARSADPLLRMLLESARNQFLEIDVDPRDATLTWFFARSEGFHRTMRELPSFRSHVPIRFDGPAEERTPAAATTLHVDRLVEMCRTEWTGLRAAYLVPAISMMSPDSMALVLEVDAASVPTPEQLRRLMAFKANPELPQRLALFLLLPEAAYQLDAGATIDFFHYTFTPRIAPDVYRAVAQDAFLVHGKRGLHGEGLVWSRFAHELVLEELEARRGAYRRFGTSSRPDGMENLRNLWRFLQLLVVERTASEGEVLLATTLPAIRRAWVAEEPNLQQPLLELERLHRSALNGSSTVDWQRAAGLMEEVYRACSREE